jgi:hypothetical protein
MWQSPKDTNYSNIQAMAVSTSISKTSSVKWLWKSLSNILLLLLLWCYSSGWALAFIPIRLQTSRSLALLLHSFIPIFLGSADTSSSHLVFGLPVRLVAYSYPYIFLGIAMSCIPLSNICIMKSEDSVVPKGTRHWMSSYCQASSLYTPYSISKGLDLVSITKNFLIFPCSWMQ